MFYNIVISAENDPKYKYKYPRETWVSLFDSARKTAKKEVMREAAEIVYNRLISEKTYELVSVVDGDTIKVKNLSGEISVRMIGLDSPESYATRYGYIECFGKEASEYLKTLLKDIKEVQLELDVTQGETDKYGRLLAYVFVNGENINKKMIADGYGWEYTYNLPYKYQTEFKEAMNYAEKNNLGLWSSIACGGERTSVEEIDTTSTTAPSNVCLNHSWILGPRGGCYYIDEKGGKVYGDHACCNK